VATRPGWRGGDPAPGVSEERPPRLLGRDGHLLAARSKRVPPGLGSVETAPFGGGGCFGTMVSPPSGFQDRRLRPLGHPHGPSLAPSTCASSGRHPTLDEGVGGGDAVLHRGLEIPGAVVGQGHVRRGVRGVARRGHLRALIARAQAAC